MDLPSGPVNHHSDHCTSATLPRFCITRTRMHSASTSANHQHHRRNEVQVVRPSTADMARNGHCGACVGVSWDIPYTSASLSNQAAKEELLRKTICWKRTGDRGHWGLAAGPAALGVVALGSEPPRARRGPTLLRDCLQTFGDKMLQSNGHGGGPWWEPRHRLAYDDVSAGRLCLCYAEVCAEPPTCRLGVVEMSLSQMMQSSDESMVHRIGSRSG